MRYDFYSWETYSLLSIVLSNGFQYQTVSLNTGEDDYELHDHSASFNLNELFELVRVYAYFHEEV
jgi:hypothetical protein